MQLVDPAKQFAKDSIRLVKRCTKPDRKGKFFVQSSLTQKKKKKKKKKEIDTVCIYTSTFLHTTLLLGPKSISVLAIQSVLHVHV